MKIPNIVKSAYILLSDLLNTAQFYLYEWPIFALWRLRHRNAELKIPCIKPFVDLEISQNGDCYLCCPSWLPVVVGNVNRSSIENIINSVKSRRLRMSMFYGDMKFCNLKLCNLINSPNFKPITIETLNKKVFYSDKIVSDISNLSLKVSAPCQVTESISELCNIRCKFCWTPYGENRTDKKILEHFSSFVLRNIDNLKMISFCGGEPFIQKHVVDIVSVAQFKPVRFYFTTNLNYLSEHMKNMLKNVNIDIFHVSLNAMSQEIYDKVVDGGSWNNVIKNMEYIFFLRDQKISEMKIRISMVVTKLNYQEIIKFAQFGIDKRVAKVIYYPMNEYAITEQQKLQIDKVDAKNIAEMLQNEFFSQYSEILEIGALTYFVQQRLACQEEIIRCPTCGT